MSNPIFHSQYTEAQIEAAIGKGPRVNASGYWEVWNVANMAYESTGVGAGVTPPTVVTQVSQMTNHGYVYIYNGTETGYTPGYWYYWDGTAWTAGGAYQSAPVDPTLSVAGAAADAKATGSALYPLVCTEDYTADMIYDKAFVVADNTPVDINDPSRISEVTGWAYIIIECSTGDYFHIKGLSASGAKGVVFIDADGVILDARYSTNNQVREYKLYAPGKSKYLIVNAKYNSDHFVRRGKSATDKVSDANSRIDALSTFVGGTKVTGWIDNYAYYLSANQSKLFYPNVQSNNRCCLIAVSPGDAIYYTGSNYTNADDTTSAARPYGFFDAGGNLISYADSGIYRDHKIIVPSGVAYVVLNQHIHHGYSDCYLGSMPRPEQDKPNFSVINKILKIVNGYTDTSLHYNSAYSPWYYTASYGENRGMTCSDWGMVALFGIDARFCKWSGMPNLVAAGFDKYSDLYKWKNDSYMWSEQIAKFIDDNYMSYTPQSDMSNVAPGDILFYDLNPDNDDDAMDYPPTGETLTRYKGVDHCAVVLDVISGDYYSVLEVAGSTQNDRGYVSVTYVPIGSREIVTALRAASCVDYDAKVIATYSPTRIVRGLEQIINITPTITAGTWVNVRVNAVRYGGSYIGVQVKYKGTNTYVTVCSEGSFGRGETAKESTNFIFKAENPIEAIKVISFAGTGGTRGMYLYKADVIDGYR